MTDASELRRIIDALTTSAAQLAGTAADLEGAEDEHREIAGTLIAAAALAVKASAMATEALTEMSEVEPALPEPEQVLNQMLIDMQQQLVEAKKQVAVAIADEKRLLKSAASERKLAEDWAKKALQAHKGDDESLARQAREREQEHLRLAASMTEQHELQSAAVSQLKIALTALSDRIGEARTHKNQLLARTKRAEAQATIASTLKALDSSSAFSTMARMMERVERMEEEADAAFQAAEAGRQSGED